MRVQSTHHPPECVTVACNTQQDRTKLSRFRPRLRSDDGAGGGPAAPRTGASRHRRRPVSRPRPRLPGPAPAATLRGRATHARSLVEHERVSRRLPSRRRRARERRRWPHSCRGGQTPRTPPEQADKINEREGARSLKGAQRACACTRSSAHNNCMQRLSGP